MLQIQCAFLIQISSFMQDFTTLMNVNDQEKWRKKEENVCRVKSTFPKINPLFFAKTLFLNY